MARRGKRSSMTRKVLRVPQGAVNTAIGTKSSASSSARGNARGVRPENMTKRMQKVNRPVIIMMIQIMSCSSGQ